MPDTKISALTAGNPALGTDQIPVARSGTNVQVTAASIAALSPAGTVTSVGGTGTVNGITLTGTVTSTGSLTLGGTLSGVSLTTQVSGTLPTVNGGTNLTSFTSGGAVYATSTSALTTGTLPLASGGTGQTTKAAAFNALSPVTSTGDLILGNGSNSNTRLAIGLNTYVLTSNGTTASWQPAAGGGGGVTSFSAGTTGFSPNSATTGAVTLSGTLGVGNGGTGVTTSPTNGQLLIGNGTGYTVATLTAGTGIAITNASGAITIAASGGPRINELIVTTPSGTFGNATPSSSASKPLIGYTNVAPNDYGAFAFADTVGGYMVSSATPSAIQIVDSTSTITNYTSGSDFSATVSAYGFTVTCFGMFIYNAGMKNLFVASAAAIASPSVAPLDASNSFSLNNPDIYVATTGPTYDNTGGPYGIVVSKIGSSYFIQFGSGNFGSAFPSVTGLYFNINNVSTATFVPGVDFTTTFSSNSTNGEFSIDLAPTNATLITLLANSFL